ncbi:unnamed protein product [Staurois parvus]|uniref:Uncharacterized protein n=1 Tax=Staurois parvus TaxID=386267 RepID=A0ABN9HIV4_9NEOB|nr:unnamed protein product [Staurois parvus]
MSPSSVFPGFHTGRYTISPSSEEYKEEDEEDGVMEEFSEGHKEMMEPPNTRKPPERCPRPLYSGIPHRKVTPSLTIARVEIQSI